MKTPTRILILLTLTNLVFSKSVKFEPNAECMLSMQVFGLEYISLTETVQLKLTFESNCKDYLHHAFFVVPFSKFYDMNNKKHPRSVILKLAGQEFRLNFINPKQNGKHNLNKPLFSPILKNQIYNTVSCW
jgi:hypothetical protein